LPLASVSPSGFFASAAPVLKKLDRGQIAAAGECAAARLRFTMALRLPQRACILLRRKDILVQTTIVVIKCILMRRSTRTLQPLAAAAVTTRCPHMMTILIGCQVLPTQQRETEEQKFESYRISALFLDFTAIRNNI
jgi:hypothetical protein